MPRYNQKRNYLLSATDFDELLEKIEPQYKALVVLLYYTGIRISEALALTPGDFTETEEILYVNVHRLKGSKQTYDLELPLTLRHLPFLLNTLAQTTQTMPLFNMTRQAVHYELHRVGLYPHFFRLNRITQILRKHSITDAQNWTGLTLQALNSYMGKVTNERIGKDLE